MQPNNVPVIAFRVAVNVRPAKGEAGATLVRKRRQNNNVKHREHSSKHQHFYLLSGPQRLWDFRTIFKCHTYQPTICRFDNFFLCIPLHWLIDNKKISIVSY